MPISQVITTLPTAPDPSTMTRDQFSTAAAASVLAQKAMVPELNTWTSQVNAIVSGTAGDIASGINGATAKTTPVDADLMTLTDSASSFTLKKLTWANLKTTLGSTFAALAGSASLPFAASALTAAGNISAIGASSTLGYGTGAGGTVTQNTSKDTGVTLHKACGTITMHAQALAAGGVVSFQFINNLIAVGDLVVVNVKWTGVGNPINYSVSAASYTGNGTILVVLKNETAGSLSEAVEINYAILKGVTS